MLENIDKNSGVVVYSYNPSYAEGVNWRIPVWDRLRAKARDPVWKLTKAKKAKGMGQVAEHLPSKQVPWV
jgi:hypothetical protein